MNHDWLKVRGRENVHVFCHICRWDNALSLFNFYLGSQNCREKGLVELREDGKHEYLRYVYRNTLLWLKTALKTNDILQLC